MSGDEARETGVVVPVGSNGEIDLSGFSSVAPGRRYRVEVERGDVITLTPVSAKRDGYFCIVCGVAQDGDLPGGVTFASVGTFGSTVYDPGPGPEEHLEIRICDDCLVNNSTAVLKVEVPFQEPARVVGVWDPEADKAADRELADEARRKVVEHFTNLDDEQSAALEKAKDQW